MRFSLVTSTFGEDRYDSIIRLIDSLKKQQHQDFELIIVDQNKTQNLRHQLNRYENKIDLTYLKQDKKGVSAGRNLGATYASGEILAFPDDDCWYPDTLLISINTLFLENPNWDGLSGCTIDLQGNLTTTKWDDEAGKIDKFNIWRRGISASIFVRMSATENIQGFDEALGIGADSPWQSSEETDYLLSLLSHHKNLYYDPAIKVYHLEPVTEYNKAALMRARKYSPGLGRVIKKHNYPFWYVCMALSRPALGSILYILQFDLWRAKFHWQIFQGRLKGWFLSG